MSLLSQVTSDFVRVFTKSLFYGLLGVNAAKKTAVLAEIVSAFTGKCTAGAISCKRVLRPVFPSNLRGSVGRLFLLVPPFGSFSPYLYPENKTSDDYAKLGLYNVCRKGWGR